MAGFDPDVFGGTTAPAGFDPDVFAGKATPPLVVAMPKAAPVAIEAGKEINSIPRQLGLTARYGIEGLANAAQIVTEPIRYVTDRLTQQTGKTLPLGELTSRGLDALGLPKPQGANERVIGDATRLVAGAGGMGALAGAPVQIGRFGGSLFSQAPSAMASRTATATGYLPRDLLTAVQSAPVSSTLSANMGAQVSSAAGAGLAGGASREGGGSPLMQGAAALGGGVLAGLAPGAIGYGLNAGKSFVNSLRPGQQQLVQQRLDQTINVTLQNQGIDPATISPAMRSALREQVGKAMNTGGDLNPEAVVRLADYTRLGMTPTRARLTLDPYDVTQEANASKLAAAAGMRSARLPEIANQNNSRLISMMDDMGGARPVDTYGQGNAVAGAILSQDEALNTRVGNLYAQAREAAGGDIPLDRKPFVDNIFGELARSGKLSFAPESIMGRINQISGGVVRANGQDFDVPFTAQTIDELKTMVATAQRATNDGNVSASLSAIRRALDNTPIAPVKNTFGGGQVVTDAGAQFLRNQDAQPAQFMDALNQARAAAAQRFNWRETAGPIDAAVSGAIPDTFIKNQIISQSAGFDGVRQAAQTINANPQAREAVRTAIVQHLKSASLGKGGTSQTGNFSGKGVEAAIQAIGDRKLGLFFEPAEVETLKAMARTGAFEVFQPRGSAVNNSNTGAAIGAMAMALADRVRPIANKLPGGELLVSKPVDYIAAGLAQRPALNVPQGLLMPRQRPPFAQNLLLPGAAYGGLLAAQ